jgi:hypothetical protein
MIEGDADWGGVKSNLCISNRLIYGVEFFDTKRYYSTLVGYRTVVILYCGTVLERPNMLYSVVVLTKLPYTWYLVHTDSTTVL